MIHARSSGNDLNLMVFSKHLAGPPLEEAAQRVRAIGIDSLDLTVRPGGHVTPERVEHELPAAVEQLAGAGCRVGMITTNITDPMAPTTEPILRTAAALGIHHFKLGYWQYDGFGSLRRQRDEVRARFRDLAAMCRQFGMVGGFHNHSDDFVGASLWDIDYILQDIAPGAIGLYFDPAHATIEGGSRGWEMGFDLLSDRIVMLAVKDFRWIDDKSRYAGARRHSVEFCPLETGNTPWPTVIERLRQIGFDGPVSMHSEYQGPFSYADLNVDEVIAQTARDVAIFRAWWTGSTAGRIDA